ncbi:MAG: hypothetical protein NXI32_14930, partial [bacterium]|nr:hypothetical protein [bacterium]
MVLRNDVDDSLQEQALEDEFALWPMNLLLVLLGSTVIALAFSYLSSTDARLLHNPWTYVVATPIVLMAISLALNTLVSRTIEKSMQMAFLLSVLVHLLFVIGAMNVVIFSRLWPDILESLAYERHQLKRQSLQAKQYYRVTSADKTGARPDYLHFVPTEHEPTELQNERADFTLADQSSENLVSPVPRIERSANPHVIERRIASPSLAVNEEAASLSRSMTQQSRQQWNQPESMPYLQDTLSPPELQSAAAVQQRRSSTTVPPQSMQLPPLQSPERQAVTTSIADRATSDALSSTTLLSSS